MSKQIKRIGEAGKALVRELCELRDQLAALEGTEVNDSAFANRYLPYSDSTWLHLRQDDYTGNTAEMLRRSREAANNIKRQIAIKAAGAGTRAFHNLQNTEAVFEAIDRARTAVDSPNRLVIYLAPTGGGKSEICKQLVRRYNAVRVECRESWRGSYKASCKDVALAAGCTEKMRDQREAEERMLDQCAKRSYLLAFDEANYFGPQTCNMVKLLLNLTSCTVFLPAIPELWGKMQRSSWPEATQLVRRAVAVIRVTALQPADVRPFLASAFDGSPRGLVTQAAEKIAHTATEFGMWDTVQRICDHLVQEHAGTDEPLKIEAVEKAIVYIRKKSGPFAS